jgi:C-terminal processing protease CtpA/Prc
MRRPRPTPANVTSANSERCLSGCDTYVEKPDDAKLIKFAINRMLTGLDPHSSYMDSKSLHEMQVETRGEFGGLCIEFTMEERADSR